MRIAIDRNEVLQLTRDLIAIESHIDAPGREAQIGRFLVAWFGKCGITADLQPVDEDRANVIARVAGGDGPSLILNGHLDTVPAGIMRDAFVPRIEQDFLWGRGACDMKGAVAAMACTLVEIERAGMTGLRSLAGDLVFVGTVGEETGSIGVKALVDAGITADYAVVGEPTSLRVAVAHKGACFLRITLTGRGAHGSCPEKGVSAASYAARIIAALEDDLRPRLAERTHPLLGASTISVGRICGGTQPNIVAERCEIDIDRRTLPGEPDAIAEVREVVSKFCDGVKGLSHEVNEMDETSIVPHVALGTSPNSKLAHAASAACRSLGLNGDTIGASYWTDGGYLAARGIETIILGPGDIANAHGPNDHVSVDSLGRAAEAYAGLAIRLLANGD